MSSSTIMKGIFYGITKRHSFKKSADVTPWIVGGIGLGGLGVGIYDALKAKGMRHGDISKYISENSVDTRKHVRNLDSTVNVVTTPEEVKKLVKKEYDGDPVIEKNVNRVLSSKTNSLSVYGKDGESYIISPKKTNPIVLDHEYGHIQDARALDAKGKLESTYHLNKGILRGLGRMLLKNVYKSDVMDRERAAWKYVADSKEKERLEHDALNSYERGFHLNRSISLAPIGGMLLGGVLGAKLLPSKIPGIFRFGSGLILGGSAGTLPAILESKFSNSDKVGF